MAETEQQTFQDGAENTFQAGAEDSCIGESCSAEGSFTGEAGENGFPAEGSEGDFFEEGAEPSDSFKLIEDGTNFYLIISFFGLVIVCLLLIYWLYRKFNSSNKSILAELDIVEDFVIKFPKEVEDYYQFKEQLPDDPNEEQTNELKNQLMRRAMAIIPIVLQMESKAPGTYRQYQTGLIDDHCFRSFKKSEEMLKAETQEIQAEAAGLEAGWGEAIFPQAMQLRRMVEAREKAMREGGAPPGGPGGAAALRGGPGGAGGPPRPKPGVAFKFEGKDDSVLVLYNPNAPEQVYQKTNTDNLRNLRPGKQIDVSKNPQLANLKDEQCLSLFLQEGTQQRVALLVLKDQEMRDDLAKQLVEKLKRNALKHKLRQNIQAKADR